MKYALSALALAFLLFGNSALAAPPFIQGDFNELPQSDVGPTPTQTETTKTTSPPPASNPPPTSPGGFEFQPIVALPLVGQNGSTLTGCTPINEYLAGVFRLAITVSVVLAVIMIIIDGFQYMTSEAVGNKKEALAGLRQALFGLVLLLASYLILFIINPSILSLSLFNSKDEGCQTTTSPQNGSGFTNLNLNGTKQDNFGVPNVNDLLKNTGYGEGQQWCYDIYGSQYCYLSQSECEAKQKGVSMFAGRCAPEGVQGSQAPQNQASPPGSQNWCFQITYTNGVIDTQCAGGSKEGCENSVTEWKKHQTENGIKSFGACYENDLNVSG
jgi:hypothetical protein